MKFTTWFNEGRPHEVAGLVRTVYGELRVLAGRYLRAQRGDHTLQPTALVHEAFLRLTDKDSIDWRGKAHFLAVSAKAMREILIDHARRRGALKRGGGRERIPLSAVLDRPPARQLDVLALDAALERLATVDPRQARVVELRFFAGMTGEEVAEVLGVSRRTVVRELAMAQAWLLREMDRMKER